MGKQTVSISFEGETMKDMIEQIISFLRSIGVFKDENPEQKESVKQ